MEMFSETFVRYAMAGGALIGGLCAYVGVYVVFKRIVFVGVALAEVAAMGVALGFFVGANPTLTALAITLAAVLLFWRPLGPGSLSRESLIGFAFVLAGALSIILVAKNPLMEAMGVDLVSGNLLYVNNADLALLVAVGLFVLIPHVVFFRKLLFVSFDKETALSYGMRADLYDLFIYFSIGLAVSVSLKISGVLFVFGSLVVPPIVALACFRRMTAIFVVAPLVALLCVLGGTALSYKADFPTAPTITLCYCLLLMAVALWKLVGGLLRGTNK